MFSSQRSKHFGCMAVVVLLAWLLMPASAVADVSASSSSASDPSATAAPHTGLKLLDWAVIALYMISMLGVGVYCSRKTDTTDDYLLGGRKMNPSAIGISLFATLLSAISYLAVPGEMVKNGPVLLWGFVAAPFAFVIVGYFLIPRFMKLQVTSAYQILEEQLGFRVRLLGSMIFLLIRFVWMALLIYLCADKVIVVILGWSPNATPWVCAVIGLITVTYTTIGGIRAVVITDVVQSFILFGGALLTVFLITIHMGGFGWWPTEWEPHWAPQQVFTLDPTVRLTVLGIILYEFCWMVCTAGSDQMAIQRYLATRDAKAARRSFLVCTATSILVRGLLAVVGFALLGYYMRYQPILVDRAITADADADQLFTHFIAEALPVGAAGLVISGLLAAAMSSLSAGVNSVCAVITADFVDPIRKKVSSEARNVKTASESGKEEGGETGEVKRARLVALVVGVIVVLTSTQMGRVSGNLIDVTFKTCNLFVAPLFGLFFLALFVRFATPFGATFASIYGLMAAALLGYWEALTGQPEIGIQWYIPTSLFVNIVAGYVFSLLPTRGRSGAALFIYSVIAALPLVGVITFVVAWY